MSEVIRALEHTSAWGFGVARFDRSGMREPRYVKRVNDLLHVFEKHEIASKGMLLKYVFVLNGM